MKTLFPSLQVRDLDRSLGFYDALGYEVVGRVDPGGTTRMAMLALPEEAEVSLELVERATDPPAGPGGLDHLAVQVDDLTAFREELRAAGLEPGPVEAPGGPDGPRTDEVVDPDGHRVELVQWPDGHPAGMTREDFR